MADVAWQIRLGLGDKAFLCHFLECAVERFLKVAGGGRCRAQVFLQFSAGISSPPFCITSAFYPVNSYGHFFVSVLRIRTRT